MLSIKLVAVGKCESYFAEAVTEYAKRLTKYCNFEIAQIKNSDIKGETDAIRPHLKGYVILCAIQGELVSSESLAAKLEKLSHTTSSITFIIGGSDGVGNYLDGLIHEKISFGRATFPHQLFRVIIAEQLYRSFTILNNEKYHK